jgi:hypothetical protein
MLVSVASHFLSLSPNAFLPAAPLAPPRGRRGSGRPARGAAGGGCTLETGATGSGCAAGRRREQEQQQIWQYNPMCD